MPSLQVWLAALRRHAGAEELRALPALPDAEAARVMALLRAQASAPAPKRKPTPTLKQLPLGAGPASAIDDAQAPPAVEPGPGTAASATPATTPGTASAQVPTPGQFRARLNLQTLTRGDGFLGLRARDGFGPRSAQLTVARITWTYATDKGLHWETPAPTRLLNTRPKPTVLWKSRASRIVSVTFSNNFVAVAIADFTVRVGILARTLSSHKVRNWTTDAPNYFHSCKESSIGSAVASTGFRPGKSSSSGSYQSIIFARCFVCSVS